MSRLEAYPIPFRAGTPVYQKCDPRFTGRVVAWLGGTRPVRVLWDDSGWKSDHKERELLRVARARLEAER